MTDEPPRTEGSRPHLRVEIALVLGVLAILFFVSEVGLRVAGYGSAHLLPASIRSSYRLEPGARFVYRGFLPGTFEDFANEVVLNDRGFHDRDYSIERPTPRTHRVMVLGDSYVAAFEVPVDATFHKRIEQRLTRADPLSAGSYEWIAFGQGNRAQEAQLQWLERFGPVYRPDVVLLVFFAGNDVMENSPVLFERARRFGDRYMREVVPRKTQFFERVMVFPFSRLNGLLAETLTTLYAANLYRFVDGLQPETLTSPELGIYEDPPTAAWRAAWTRTTDYLSRIAATAEGQGSRLIVAGLSGPQAVGDVGLMRMWQAEQAGIDWARPLEKVADWAQEARVPFVDLTGALQSAGRRRVYWRHDAHLTPEGHDVVAGALYDFLYAEGGRLR